MASFPLKKAHFSYPLHLTSNLKIFFRYITEIVYARVYDIWLITRAKSFLTTYLLERVHPLLTNGRTDRRTTTMPIALTLLKYNRLITRLIVWLTLILWLLRQTLQLRGLSVLTFVRLSHSFILDARVQPVGLHCHKQRLRYRTEKDRQTWSVYP